MASFWGHIARIAVRRWARHMIRAEVPSELVVDMAQAAVIDQIYAAYDDINEGQGDG